ncbi:MAG: hypothetical protein WB792_09240 [Desulfobacterales bacterium]
MRSVQVKPLIKTRDDVLLVTVTIKNPDKLDSMFLSGQLQD